MNTKVNCIMLVDDNKVDNFFHERVICKNLSGVTVVAKTSAYDALDYLKSGEALPDIVFLDVNMPGMSGYGFLSEYKKLPVMHNCLIVLMISNFDDPDDEAIAATEGVFSAFRPKPLTKEALDELILYLKHSA